MAQSMVDCFRTLSAHLITRHRFGPRTCSGVQVRAWAWLAPVLKLDPGLEWARVRHQEWGIDNCE
jgi:hypothetical protein